MADPELDDAENEPAPTGEPDAPDPDGDNDEKQAEPEHKGFMVAFIPSDMELDTIEQPGGLPADELHLTLRYYKSPYTPETLEAAHHAAADIAANLQPFVVPVTGRRQFGDDTPAADVLICGLHNAMSFARDHIPPSDADYPQFTPHVTVGYGIGDEALAAAAADNDIMFDAIAVCIGDDMTLYELGDIDPEDGEGLDPDTGDDDVVMLNEDGTTPEAVTAGVKGMIDGRVNTPSRRGGNKLDPRPSGSKQKCYHGSPASCRSVKWISVYTALRDKGYSKRKSAMIANSMHNKWKKGIPNKVGQRPMIRKTI